MTPLELEQVDVRKCSACGGDHNGLYVGRHTSYDNKKVTFCPTTNQPIYVITIPNDDASRT